MMRKKRLLFRVLVVLFSLAVLCSIGVLVINGIVVQSTQGQILTLDQAATLENVDCILVLGCGVWEDGRPSHMLEDRLRMCMELYVSGVSSKLLMTGDHGREDYDEVNTMKLYAVSAGVPSQDVFMDHAGFSTYESMYRAKEIFQVKRVVIVTQGYHLYRAIYIAESLGLEAYGVAADYRGYAGQFLRDLREVLARVKDFGVCILQPQPTYLGEDIPIWGNGNETNDNNSDFT